MNLEPDSNDRTEQTQRLLHDLRVHQVELEAQNEELRSTQGALQEARAQYFDLYDLAPVGYFALTEHGLIAQLNRTAANLLGVANELPISQPLARFVLADDRPLVVAYRQQLFASGAPLVCEVRMVRSDGSLFWARLEGTSLCGGQGPTGWRVVVSDITERKHAEQTLQASEMRYRVLFESSHDAQMILAPPSWRFTSGNSAALRMFGARDPADLQSLPPLGPAPERQPDGRKSQQKARASIETAMRLGTHLFEWRYRHPSGQDRSASVLLTRVELDGQPLLQAAVRDITEAKALQARMAQSERLATMGMLAAGVAHEINNPLTYVVFSLERLGRTLAKLTQPGKQRSGALPKVLRTTILRRSALQAAGASWPALVQDAAQCAQHALDGVTRIQQIARGLGTFSRVDDVELSPVSLNSAIEQAVVLAMNEIRYRAKLVEDYGQLPLVRASEGKLSQVFLNLLVNAAHSLAEDNVASNRISIRTWSENGQVFAEVRDTGKGIPRENHELIFEPFFTTNEVGKGSGLGLSICRSIVSALGGRIEVASELGIGTGFTVSLPLTEVNASARVGTAPEGPMLVAPRGRVLIVDDEALIREGLRQLLANQHTVMIAASGSEARAILERGGGFDVILCDLMMPNMSGMDLHAWLVSRDPLLAKRVVFMSGGAFTPKASSYLASVDNRRLDKPFDSRVLETVVAEFVVAAKAAAAPVLEPPMIPRRGLELTRH